MENKQVIVIGGVRGGKSEAIQKAKEMLQNENVEFVDYGCVSSISNDNEYSCTNEFNENHLKELDRFWNRDFGIPTKNNISDSFTGLIQSLGKLDSNYTLTKERSGAKKGSFGNKVSKRRSKNKSARKSKQRNRK